MTTEYRTLAPGVHDKTSDSPVTDANLKTNVLGYSTLFTWNIGPQTVFFLGHKQEGISQEDFLSKMQKTQGLIELLWLHSDEQNEEPATPKSHDRPGFFHIGFTVDNVQDILDRTEKYEGKIIKRLGKPDNLAQLGMPVDCPPLYEECPGPLGKIAFITDPDGNWIELIPTVMHK